MWASRVNPRTMPSRTAKKMMDRSERLLVKRARGRRWYIRRLQLESDGTPFLRREMKGAKNEESQEKMCVQRRTET